MSRKPIHIIIPTYNNLDYLMPCIKSIAANTVEYYRFNIVNNGAKESMDYLTGDINILNPGKNLGWMGGINAGLQDLKNKGIDYDYVLLMNDDTHIMPNDYDWLYKLRNVLDNDPTVAAVGPSSNVVAGWQNMRHVGLPALLETKFIIGFCVLIRKSALDEIGWLDESLPGGDDLDWCMEFRKRGYKVIARRDSFVFHHGFKTGERIHGGPEVKGGWNSLDYTETVNQALIRKHGFKTWLETIRNEARPYDTHKEEYNEGNCFESIIKGKGLDIGCGPNKIHPDCIGVDLVAKGGTTFQGATSAADVQASGDDMYMFENGSIDYIVSRHNIEHYSNVVKTLKEWRRVLKVGGKLGMSTPDDSKLQGMRLDDSHKHSLTRDAMKDLLDVTGFKVVEMGGTANGWNFYVIAEAI